ncbi:MAG: hypothetical protein WCP20_18915 [Desulfuromonadales bacterium]
MDECVITNDTIFETIKGTSLFYPCSGNDMLVPVQLFSPHVTDFWFVDKGYFSPGNQDTRYYGLDIPADKQSPLLADVENYELLERNIEGPPQWDYNVRNIKPCILYERYRHRQSNTDIHIRRRRGYGFSAFRNEISSIGVFFYRGDSQGEGGSGNLWLIREHLDEVCNKLINGGLIVTDGSNYGHRSRRGPLSRYNFKEVKKTGQEIIDSCKSFTDKSGRRFECLGYVGHRYGPTLIWQVHKPAQ